MSQPPPPAATESDELFSRAAFASIRGYVYQAWVGVLRWLELPKGGLLRFEGHEDIDCCVAGLWTYEQVKDVSERVGLGSRVFREALRRFLVRYVETLGSPGATPRFLFTTTAPLNRKVQKDDELRAWFSGEQERLPAAYVTDLRGVLDPADESFKRIDNDNGWEAFAGTLRARVSAPSGEDLFDLIHGRLEEQERSKDAPISLLAERLLAEVLWRSTRANSRDRTVDREDLEKLLAKTKDELEAWARDARHEELVRTVAGLQDAVADFPELLFTQLDDREQHAREDRAARVLLPGTLPRPEGHPTEIAPSKLLRAAYQHVRFQGREETLRDLIAWMDSAEGFGVRLIHGPGGEGKSRLAIELIRRSRSWLAGFVRIPGTENDLRFLGEGLRPRLLVVDYANEDPTRVKSLLASFLGGCEARKVRILLLARHEHWLQTLRPSSELEREFFGKIEPVGLQPLYEDGAVRERAFVELLGDYTGRDRKSARAALRRSGIDLEDEPLERALYLHMLALVAAWRSQPQGSLEGLPRGKTELLQAILEKEMDHHWQRALSHHGIADADLADGLAEMRVVAAVATATGGLSYEAHGTIPWEDLGVSQHLEPALKALSLEYGAGRWAPAAQIPPHEPDLLGEYLVWSTLAPEQLAALAQVLTPLDRFPMLRLLARIPAHEGEAEKARSPRNWSRQALDSGRPLWLEAAKVVAPHAEHERGELGDHLLAQATLAADDKDWAESLLPGFLEGYHPLLDTQRACMELRLGALDPTGTGGGDPAQVAAIHNSLAVTYARLGGREKGLQHAERALALYRELAAARPEAFQPGLATSLNNLGNSLGGLGRREEALAAVEESVALRRELAAARPEAFRPDLAGSLNNLSVYLEGLGRREEALAAIEEAVALHRELAAARPDAFRPGLATSLNNLSNGLEGLGRREEALVAIDEAVALYGELAAEHPERFQPDLAMSLNNLSGRLEGLGRREEALAAIEEAVALHRGLAAARPEAFRPHLAMSLNNLAGRLEGLGRREEALAAIEEAVALYRELAAARPEAFRPELAGNLNNLSVYLEGLGRREEALAAIEEAVALHRELAAQHPEAFLPDLAMSLNNLSIGLERLRRREEALASIDEAVAIRRELADARPEAFRPDLAMSLNNLSVCLGGLGRREEALAAIEEAVALYSELAVARPEAFRPDLAMSFNNLSGRLDGLGRREEALAAIEEAVAMRRELAAARPEAFRPDLAASLNNLGGCLERLGRRKEGLAAIEEAVALYRELAAARPEAFRPDLARCLGARGSIELELDPSGAAASFHEALMCLLPQLRRAPRAFGELAASLVSDAEDSCRRAGIEPDAELMEEVARLLAAARDP